MTRTRWLAGATALFLVGVVAVVAGTPVHPPETTSTSAVVSAKAAIFDDGAAVAPDIDTESRTRSARRRAAHDDERRFLLDPFALLAALLVGLSPLGATRAFRHHPAVSAWSPGAIRGRAPPLPATV